MRGLVLLIVLLALAYPASADVFGVPPPFLRPVVAGAPVSGASYTGPGDIDTYSMWWGLRCYSAAYAAPGTNIALQVVRSSDSTTINVKCLTTGQIDVGGATSF